MHAPRGVDAGSVVLVVLRCNRFGQRVGEARVRKAGDARAAKDLRAGARPDSRRFSPTPKQKSPPEGGLVGGSCFDALRCGAGLGGLAIAEEDPGPRSPQTSSPRSTPREPGSGAGVIGVR